MMLIVANHDGMKSQEMSTTGTSIGLFIVTRITLYITEPMTNCRF